MSARVRNIIPLSLLLLFLSITSISCSTKKNTVTRRAFHNLTSHYNPYWNGLEAFDAGMKELDNQIKTNYTETLPVENFGNLQQAQAINSHLDRAIEKASKVVQKHSMFFERKELVRRVPDSYMLLGKSYFYKQDYFLARQTFEYVAQRYERQPIRFWSHLWQARTAIKLREYERSVTILDKLQTQVRRGDFPKDILPEIPIVYALHYTEQQDYKAAKPYLRKAADINRDKKIRARMYYILGQISQMEGNYSEANKYYASVIKLNPPYEMKFSATIRRAECFDAGRGSSKGIVDDLNKLLKDKKNKEFEDQIYYALALVALRENKDTTAYNYLRQSVAVSVSNDFQKVLSARKLADLYFDIPKFQDAYRYYDTTMQVLQYDYPDFSIIEERTDALKHLVEHLDVIQHQDSLQKLAAMPEAERNKIIDKIISDYKAEQERIKKLEEAEALLDRPMMPTMPGRDPSRGMLQQVTGGGGWYFYNPQSIAYGASDFARKWGRRKLEDNWRVSDKRVYSSFDSDDQEEMEGDSIAGEKDGKLAGDPLKRDTYLEDIPLTPEDIAASNELVADAMYKAAYVFREELRDYPRSIETFEALLSRFPLYEQELSALFHLYTLNVIENNHTKADEYKSLIISKYPDSEYTKALSDPDYYTKKDEKKRRVESLYQDTYMAYKNDQHRMVVLYSNEAESAYPDSELLPKFAFLRTLAIGGLHNQDTLITYLKRYIGSYSSSDLVPLAQDMLASFGIEGFEEEVELTPEEEETKKEAEKLSIYSLAPDDNHLFILILNLSKSDPDASKIRISDFNSNNYKLANLTLNTVMLDNEHQMISVGNFKGMEHAMAYYNAIVKSDYVLSPQVRKDSYYFMISSGNYPVFYRDKEIDTYVKFFEKNYLEE